MPRRKKSGIMVAMTAIAMRIEEMSARLSAIESICAATSENTRLTTDFASRILRNTVTIRQDIDAIREGRTGAGSRPRKDPLSRAKRRQVDEVKRLYFGQQDKDCRLSVSALANRVIRTLNIRGGYPQPRPLALRASLELRRT